MTTARAAEVLRGWDKAWSDKDARGAANLGADALEFQTWLFDKGESYAVRVRELYVHWRISDEAVEFLDYARAEWEKERKR